MATDLIIDPAAASGALEPVELDSAGDERAPAAPLIERESLVEDVSIDGMCGVY